MKDKEPVVMNVSHWWGAQEPEDIDPEEQKEENDKHIVAKISSRVLRLKAASEGKRSSSSSITSFDTKNWGELPPLAPPHLAGGKLRNGYRTPNVSGAPRNDESAGLKEKHQANDSENASQTIRTNDSSNRSKEDALEDLKAKIYARVSNPESTAYGSVRKRNERRRWLEKGGL